MGKHDKQEVITAERADSYYRERIRRLENEATELRRTLAKETEAYEHSEEMLNGVIGELREQIAELKAENEKLWAKIKEEILR